MGHQPDLRVRGKWQVQRRGASQQGLHERRGGAHTTKATDGDVEDRKQTNILAAVKPFSYGFSFSDFIAMK